MQPPQRFPCLAELAVERAVDIEIQQDRAAAQEDGPSQRTISQQEMLACANVMRLPMSPKNLAHWKYPREMIHAVLNQETGEMMEYRQEMKNPKYRELYEKEYAKELGRLAQGITGLADGTKNIFH